MDDNWSTAGLVDYLLAFLAAYLQHGYGLLTASGLLCLMLQYVSATTRMNHGISANDRIVALFFSIYKGSWLSPMQDRQEVLDYLPSTQIHRRQKCGPPSTNQRTSTYTFNPGLLGIRTNSLAPKIMYDFPNPPCWTSC